MLAVESRQCSRAFLMVSGTLRSEGGAVDEIVDALGEMCVGLWHGMPAHTPRDAVLDAAQEATWLTACSISVCGIWLPPQTQKHVVELCANGAS